MERFHSCKISCKILFSLVKYSSNAKKITSCPFTRSRLSFSRWVAEISPWCFKWCLMTLQRPSRKPVIFCLVGNISMLLSFLNTIVWKWGERRPGLWWNGGLALSRWWQNFCQVRWQSLWAKRMLMRTAMSHDDIRSLFVHQSRKPDVLPSPARTPSVPRISRLSSWGSFLGKETCYHFGDSESLWSFKTGLRKEEFFFEGPQQLNVRVECGGKVRNAGVSSTGMLKEKERVAAKPSMMGLEIGELGMDYVTWIRSCLRFLPLFQVTSWLDCSRGTRIHQGFSFAW